MRVEVKDWGRIEDGWSGGGFEGEKIWMERDEVGGRFGPTRGFEP